MNHEGDHAPVAARSLPMMRPRLWRIGAACVRFGRATLLTFREKPPTTLVVFTPLLLLALILFTRHPATNYIFDEQEALLANPYVNARAGLTYGAALSRDFWGLPPEASIGSYRPIPNLIWRAIWSLHAHLPATLAHVPKHPFVHHLVNIFLHALNAALLASFTFAVTRRKSVAWLVALTFLTSAVLTEAVTGIVGLADVLGGLGAVLALAALRLPAWGMPFGVFTALLIGMFSKESALVCVPLVPAAAFLTAPLLHGERPARVTRALLALAATVGAFMLYVELRKQWFPSPLPEALQEALPPLAGRGARLFRSFLVWFHQAPLPKDPLNNPFVGADTPHRIAGALRVYWRGLGQLVFPLRLSGDYSFPQEPVPATLRGWETVAGAAMMVLPPVSAFVLWLRGAHLERRAANSTYREAGARQRGLGDAGILALVAGLVAMLTEHEMIGFTSDAGGVRTWPVGAALVLLGLGLRVESGRRKTALFPVETPAPWPQVLAAMVALGLLWVVVSYFPHSNIPVVLPTVRAERFWYFPVLGSSLVLGVLFAWSLEHNPSATPRLPSWALGVLLGAFFGFQGARAYLHSMDYRDDLSFWYATKESVPQSAKAHLNYSVMVGARGDLVTRLTESHIARQLAPKWPMAHIYTGDTLCRMDRMEEAWPHYAEGFALGPNEKALISLALQCMHDKNGLLPHADELRAIAEKPEGNSWVAYLVNDTLLNHEKNKGVDPQYRPRGYNEGSSE